MQIFCYVPLRSCLCERLGHLAVALADPSYAASLIIQTDNPGLRHGQIIIETAHFKVSAFPYSGTSIISQVGGFHEKSLPNRAYLIQGLSGLMQGRPEDILQNVPG